MEKNMKKKNAYMCITESLCCTAEMGTTLQISYTLIKKNKLKKKETMESNLHDLELGKEILNITPKAWFFKKEEVLSECQLCASSILGAGDTATNKSNKSYAYVDSLIVRKTVNKQVNK